MDQDIPQTKMKDESDSDTNISEPDSRRTRNLLSLDGGGVQGLASLAVLDKLMRLVDPVHPPKPCHVFDMIGGTSTGGLIAMMLGRLEMSVDECMEAYRSLATRSFTPRGGWPVPFVFDWTKFLLNPRCRFDSAELEQVIKGLVKWRLKDENETLLQTNPDCKVFVCATSAIDFYTTRTFQNYASPGIPYLFPNVKIWEACRATSAAPGFFEPITIHYGNHYRDTFRDGATGCNNPVEEVYENARKLWPDDELCVISIGTGRPVKYDWRDNLTELIRVLIKISTETERTARNFVLAHPAVRYFRFNVENGVGEIGLHEHEKADQILADSHNFLERPNLKQELGDCAEILRNGNMYESHSQEIAENPETPFKLVAKASSALAPILKYLLFLFISIAVAWILLQTQGNTGPQKPPLNLNWPVFAVIGRTGAGKSSFIKILGGRHIGTMELPVIGESLKSCTDQISWFKAIVDGKPLYLIDTPGFDDDNLDDESILKMIWNDFKHATSMKDRHVTGMILLHDITQQRFGGGMLKNMDSLQDLLGHEDFYRLALVTTGWSDNVDQKTHDTWVDREHQLIEDYWKDLVDAGAEVIRHDGTLQRATIVIQQLILNREKKRWSKSRQNRRTATPSNFTETPKSSRFSRMWRKDWLWRTEFYLVICVAIFGLILLVPRPEAQNVRATRTPFYDALELCAIIDTTTIIYLLINLIATYVYSFWQ